jgi:hypothetical protein
VAGCRGCRIGRILDILVKFNSSVGELAEGSSLLELGGGLSVL